MQQFLKGLVHLCGMFLLCKSPVEIRASIVCTSTLSKGGDFPLCLDLHDCTMDCQGMQLTSIPRNFPWKLTEIDLSDNLITTLHYLPFANLRNLETLRLRNNRIRQIEHGTFKDLTALSFLDLSDNQIAYLEADTFYRLHNLAFFAFEGNPFRCSCPMLALKKWIGIRNMSVVPPTCSDDTGNEFEFLNYSHFPSCSADGELFTTDLTCSLSLSMDTDQSPKRNCPLEFENPVCYSSLSYTDENIIATKGCMEDRECHNFAAKNTDTCFNTHGERECTFCCLHHSCNEDNFDGRTKDVLFIAAVSFCMEDNNDLRTTYNTSKFTSSFINFVSGTHLSQMKTSLSSILEFNGLPRILIEDISFQNLTDCDELIVICSISYTTLREIDEQVMVEVFNYTLVSNFFNFRYLPHTLRVSLVKVKIPYCVTDKTENEKGIFLWDNTPLDTYAALYCIAEKTLDLIPVFRECMNVNDRPVWGPPNTRACIDKIHTLTDIAAANISDANADHIASKLLTLSSNSSHYTASEVELVTVALEDILLLESTFHLHERGRALVQIIDRLFSVSASTLTQADEKKNIAYRLLHLIDKLTANIDVSEDDFKAEGTELAVFAFKTNADEYKGATCVLRNIGSTTGLRMHVYKYRDIPDSTAHYIRLPETLISKLSREDKALVTRITGGFFSNDMFFRAIESRSRDKKDNGHLFLSSTKVNSAIYIASVPGVRILNLTEPIEFRVKQKQKNAKNPACAYFAEESMDNKRWKGEGCYVKMHVPGNYTVCACNHLTNFALLMDVYGTSALISQDHRTALSILSYVGCVISLTGLTLTLLTYCLFRPLRTTRPALILMNLCGALTGLNVVFLIGEHDYVFNNEGICKFVAVFLHYFLLTAIMWMLVEAFYFFMTIVLIWNSHIHRFFLKICAFGWGIPLGIVGVTWIVRSGRNYGLQGGGICWLDQPSFYGAVLAPLCAMLTINTGVFVTVLRRILGMHSKKLNKTEARQTSQRIRGSLTAIVMLGLTWGISIFAIGNNSASLMFQYLFAVFNSLQGFFIFLFHCILKSEVQKVWSKMICKKKPVALGTSNGIGNMSTINASTTPNKSD